MIGQRTTSQRSGGDLLLQPLVEPCGTYPCKAGIFTWIQTVRHGSERSGGAGNEYFGYINWLTVSCLIAVDELIVWKQIRIRLKNMWRHDTGTIEEFIFSTLKEFSMRLRGGSLIQKRWRLEVLSFSITLSTVEVPSRQTIPAQRLLPWWSRCHGKREHDTFSGLSWVMEAVTPCSWNDTPLWVNRIEHSQYLISIFRAKTALVYSMSHCPWESF